MSYAVDVKNYLK